MSSTPSFDLGHRKEQLLDLLLFVLLLLLSQHTADDIIQDFVHQTRRVRPVAVHIDANDTSDALKQGISNAKAKLPEAPTELELANDASVLISFLNSLARILIKARQGRS
ncbi:hypothetical protein HGRIS_011916 [Hohenbuehelia grisea]|uniref:Uncharacterized protein n=1 Tax=Hohenbuehelia grisea TaxID=104357 RepID=A0ABR3JWI8_9AGAR